MKCKPIQDACRAYIQDNGFLRGMSQAAIGVIFAYPLFALLNSVAGTVVFAYFEAPSFYFFILSAGLLFASGNFIMLTAGFGAGAVVSLVAFIMAIVNSARWGGFAFSIVSALLELVVMGLLTLLSCKAYSFGRPSARPAAYQCPQCGGPVIMGALFYLLLLILAMGNGWSRYVLGTIFALGIYGDAIYRGTSGIPTSLRQSLKTFHQLSLYSLSACRLTSP